MNQSSKKWVFPINALIGFVFYAVGLIVRLRFYKSGNGVGSSGAIDMLIGVGIFGLGFLVAFVLGFASLKGNEYPGFGVTVAVLPVLTFLLMVTGVIKW